MHHSMFLFIIEQGLKLDKIYRVLKFNQSPWLKRLKPLKTFIELDQPTNFETTTLILLYNAVYGKCLESVPNRVDRAEATQQPTLLSVIKAKLSEEVLQNIGSVSTFATWNALKNALREGIKPLVSFAET